MSEAERLVRVPAPRLETWFANFARSHGEVTVAVADGAVRADAADGSWAVASAPFDRVAPAGSSLAHLAALCAPPERWGVLVVRKGGFAVARLAYRDTTASTVGRRHVQGRTKAGGQSQQRFARRRDNQARAAYEAAAQRAVEVFGTDRLEALVTGGDRAAVDAVLADPRLARHAAVRTSGHLAVAGDPRRDALNGAVEDACAATVRVRNA